MPILLLLSLLILPPPPSSLLPMISSEILDLIPGIVNREYFKEASIETKTIVETIENGQGCD